MRVSSSGRFGAVSYTSKAQGQSIVGVYNFLNITNGGAADAPSQQYGASCYLALHCFLSLLYGFETQVVLFHFAAKQTTYSGIIPGEVVTPQLFPWTSSHFPVQLVDTGSGDVGNLVPQASSAYAPL
jgi:hypothetical protein